MTTDRNFLFDGPGGPGGGDASPLVVLAHGAGAPMDSPFMTNVARGLAGGGGRGARFGFSYVGWGLEAGRTKPPGGRLRGQHTPVGYPVSQEGPGPIVRNRRMKGAHPSALRRSMRRVQGFEKLARRTISFTRRVKMKKRKTS